MMKAFFKYLARKVPNMPKILFSFFTALIVIFGFSFAQADKVIAVKVNMDDPGLEAKEAETNGVVCDYSCPECMKSVICQKKSFTDFPDEELKMTEPSVQEFKNSKGADKPKQKK